MRRQRQEAGPSDPDRRIVRADRAAAADPRTYATRQLHGY